MQQNYVRYSGRHSKVASKEISHLEEIAGRGTSPDTSMVGSAAPLADLQPSRHAMVGSAAPRAMVRPAAVPWMDLLHGSLPDPVMAGSVDSRLAMAGSAALCRRCAKLCCR